MGILLTKDKYYLSGPMTGLPESNYPEFDEAARVLREKGYRVENPAENFRELQAEARANLPWSKFMARAIVQMIDCNNIVLLPGWSTSRGARYEFGLAVDCGHRVYYYRKGLKNPLLEIK